MSHEAAGSGESQEQPEVAVMAQSRVATRQPPNFGRMPLSARLGLYQRLAGGSAARIFEEDRLDQLLEQIEMDAKRARTSAP